MGQATIVVTALLAVVFALVFAQVSKNLFDIVQGIMSLLAPPLAVVFLLGVLWKRMNNVAAQWVLYFGGTACVLIAGFGFLNQLSQPYVLASLLAVVLLPVSRSCWYWRSLFR